jgi:flavin-dependent dehydrogenase
MKLQARQRDVFIVGGGPAGLGAAIAARQAGLRATVADSRLPPIDKACGEGLMPEAVAALRTLGVRFAEEEAIPFLGIRFLDGRTGISTEARFPFGAGLAVRRTTLHRRLAERAAEVGAEIRWGARVSLLDRGQVACEGCQTDGAWIIGADGLQSQVRQWSGLHPSRRELRRFGFRRHFRVRPWTDFVEVYWGASCQIAVTPSAAGEVGLAAISRNPNLRIDAALREMPALAAHLAGAEPTTSERGAPCVLRQLPAISRGSIALVGDASGSVDPVTGEGLGLAFRQAIALAEALRCADLRSYESAHRSIVRRPCLMSQLVLLMDGNPWLRRRTLRALAAEPHLFAYLLDAEAGNFFTSFTAAGLLDAMRMGWRLARP